MNILYNELITIFNNAEKKAKLFDIEICGIKLWQYIRIEVYRCLEREVLNCIYIPIWARTRSRFIKNKKYAQQEYLNKLQKADILVFDYLHRYINLNGKKICPVTGNIEESIFNCSRISLDYSGATIDAIPLISPQKINKIFLNDNINQIIKSLNSECDVLTSTQFFIDIENAICYILYFMRFIDFFAEIINRIKPKCLVFSNGYAIPSTVMAITANTLNIPVIEMQHGIFGAWHIAYNFPAKVIPEYCAKYFFSYGEYYRSFLVNLFGDNIFTVGSFMLDNTLLKFQNKKRKISSKILIISTINNEDLIKIAIDLVAKARIKGLSVVYRLHPEENDNINSLLVNSGIEIRYPLLESVYESLGDCVCVLGQNSTVLYEAAALGILALQLNGIHADKHPFPIINNPEDIFFLINSKMHRKDTHEFFVENAMNNFENAIKNILA